MAPPWIGEPGGMKARQRIDYIVSLLRGGFALWSRPKYLLGLLI